MPSFVGFVNTPLDAALLIAAGYNASGLVVPIKGRLGQQERSSISSGACFVFSEQETGIRRWTDGMRWSKSRVEGQFLVYRRLPADESPSNKRRRVSHSDDDDKDKRKQFISAPVGDDVLCKKTFAVMLSGNICYYTRHDVLSRRLSIPSSMPEFMDIQVPSHFLDPANFKLHPKGLGHSSQQNYSYATPPSTSRSCTPIEQKRYVTVHRMGDGQTIHVTLPADLNIFKRMVMHAFQLQSLDQTRFSIGPTFEISDQSAFDQVRDGDVIQVQTFFRSLPMIAKLGIPTPVRIMVERVKNEGREHERDGQTFREDGEHDTTSAAFALTQLAAAAAATTPDTSLSLGISNASNKLPPIDQSHLKLKPIETRPGDSFLRYATSPAHRGLSTSTASVM